MNMNKNFVHIRLSTPRQVFWFWGTPIQNSLTRYLRGSQGSPCDSAEVQNSKIMRTIKNYSFPPKWQDSSF